MTPHQRLATARLLARMAVLVGILCLSEAALPQSPDLGPTRDTLAHLEKCLGAGNEAIAKLSQGLLSGWGSRWSNGPNPLPPPPPLERAVEPPPLEYLASLQADLEACELAKKQSDPALRQAILDEVIQDISVKANDCEKSGMGRLIQVRVSTMRGPTAENGWVVFWRWMPAGPLQTVETSMPSLTSPASKQLPPGTYAFRAEKRVSATQLLSTETRVIIVGGEQTIECPLAIE